MSLTPRLQLHICMKLKLMVQSSTYLLFFRGESFLDLPRPLGEKRKFLNDMIPEDPSLGAFVEVLRHMDLPFPEMDDIDRHHRHQDDPLPYGDMGVGLVQGNAI